MYVSDLSYLFASPAWRGLPLALACSTKTYPGIECPIDNTCSQARRTDAGPVLPAEASTSERSPYLRRGHRPGSESAARR